MTHEPSIIAFWLESAGQRYWVQVDQDRALLSAEIEIQAHDKRLTMRKVVNKVTLSRLQGIVRPVACPVCGADA